MVGKVARILVAIACGVWLALGAAPAARAQATIQASVDRAEIRDNESFTFVLRADGAVRGEPEDGPLAAQFDILNRSSSRRVGIVNGRTSEVSEWQYQLMPKSAGEFTIPVLRVGDRQSNPVTVRVQAPEPGSAPAADIFMELSAEPAVVYAQSQVLFTLRLFVGVSTGRATLTAPETSGVEAIVEKLGEDSQYQTKRGSRDFVVRERRYAVFPQQPGALTIGPVTFEAMVIPDRGFSRVQRFRSDVLELTVEPAVAPPAAMAGAAWLPAQQVTLSEVWSDAGDELAVGIPRTRTIVIEGLGLLETQLPEVPIASQPGIRQYADQPELTREITAGGLLSRRSVSLAVIAQAEGAVTLAGVELPWWNVREQRWEVASLPPHTLRVTPSAEPPSAAATVDAAAPPERAATPAPSLWPIASGLFALGWVLTIVLWLRARGGANRGAPMAPVATPQADRRPALKKILRDLGSACAVSDSAAARRSLLAFAEARFPAAPPRSLGALAAELPDTLAAEVLALEGHIYGSQEGTWRGDGLQALLPALEQVGAPAEVPPADPLLPLYR